MFSTNKTSQIQQRTWLLADLQKPCAIFFSSVIENSGFRQIQTLLMLFKKGLELRSTHRCGSGSVLWPRNLS
jgi:hypothetical protein